MNDSVKILKILLLFFTGNFDNQSLWPMQYKLVQPNENKECMLCGRRDSSELLYGPLYQQDDIVVHHFCIVSAYYL